MIFCRTEKSGYKRRNLLFVRMIRYDPYSFCKGFNSKPFTVNSDSVFYLLLKTNTLTSVFFKIISPSPLVFSFFSLVILFSGKAICVFKWFQI